MNTRRQNINGSIALAVGLLLVLALRLYGVYGEPVTKLSSKSENYLLIVLVIGIVYNLIMALVAFFSKEKEVTEVSAKRRNPFSGWLLAFLVVGVFFVLMIFDRTNQGSIISASDAPLSVSDLEMHTENPADTVTYMQQSALFARYLYVSQSDTSGEDTLLTYQVFTPQTPALLPLTFDRMLSAGTRTFGNTTRSYAECDPAPFDADTAYRLEMSEGDIAQYLLLYNDRIIEIFFVETPSDADMQTAVAELR